jgi:hypothetical protein
MNIDPINGYVGINIAAPTHRLHVSGDVRFQGDSRAYFGPNSSWGADLIIGGNGRTDSGRATVAATNGNLHIDAANGYELYLNYYSGRNTLTHSGYTMWHSGNLTNLSQLANGPGFVTSAGSVTQLNGILWNRFVYGDNTTKTSYPTTNWNTAQNSGFYNASSTTGNPFNDWWHGVITRHVNEGNDYQFQMLHNFFQDANVQVRTVSGGSYQSWRSIWMNGGTNGLTNLSQLTNGPSFLGKFGNAYYQLDTWMQTNGHHGLYSPINGAHWYPNDASYGSWRMLGTRNGWAGIEGPGNGAGNVVAMMNSNDGDDCWESGIVIFNERVGKLNLFMKAYERLWNDEEELLALWKPYDAQVLGHIATQKGYFNLCEQPCKNVDALANTRYKNCLKHWINKDNKALLCQFRVYRQLILLFLQGRIHLPHSKIALQIEFFAQFVDRKLCKPLF